MKYYCWGVKTTILPLVLSLAFCLVSCGGNEKVEVEIAVDPASFNYGIEPAQVSKIEFDNSAGAVSYTKHEFTCTQFGTDIVIVYFGFVNNSTEYQCLHDVANFRAYQDGMEIDGCQLDSEEGDNSWREIAKGKSIECAIAFKASNNNPVYLRVSPVIDGCFDTSVYQEQELSS